MNTEWTIEGNAWKVGDNVNTESITPSRWLHEGPEALMKHIGELLIPEFPNKVQQGDIWVAGSNLGCSSSRNAPQFLKQKGIGAVVCHSASRIFYRNALNAGLPIYSIGEDVKKINMGDRLRVFVREARIMNLAGTDEFTIEPFPDFIMDILEAGGIDPYVLQRKDQFKFLK